MQQHNRILVVDDNPSNIAIPEELLSDDYELGPAASGEEIDRLKTVVLSLLSHETNTPLHGLLLSAEMLSQNEASREEQQNCAKALPDYTPSVRKYSNPVS